MGKIYIYKQDKKLGLVGFEIKKSIPVTTEIAREIGNKLKVAWDLIDIEQLRIGIEMEQEHAESLQEGLITAARIALDHLIEIPDYYTRLKVMEDKAKLEEKGAMAVEKGGPGSGRYPSGSGKEHNEEDVYDKASNTFENELENNPKASIGDLNEIMEREHPTIPTEMRDRIIDRIIENQFSGPERKLEIEREKNIGKDPYAKPRSLKDAPPRTWFDDKGRAKHQKWLETEKMVKGGVNSGRYPKGSGKEKGSQERKPLSSQEKNEYMAIQTSNNIGRHLQRAGAYRDSEIHISNDAKHIFIKPLSLISGRNKNIETALMNNGYDFTMEAGRYKIPVKMR